MTRYFIMFFQEANISNNDFYRYALNNIALVSQRINKDIEGNKFISIRKWYEMDYDSRFHFNL